MGRQHHVVVGSSWGSLPASLRQWWTSVGCDRLLPRARATSAAAEPEASRSVDSPGGECQALQLAYKVRRGVDWGTLPLGKQDRWTELGCDRLVN